MEIQEQLLCFLLVTIIGCALGKVNEDATTGTKCLKDEALRDYPVNIYYCDDPKFPTCCQRDFTYDCCEDESAKNWKEQLILWGSVSGAILLILLVCLFFWKEDLCGGKSPCKKWKEKRNAKKHEEKKPLDQADEVGSNRTIPVPVPYDNPISPYGEKTPVQETGSGRESSMSKTSYQSQQPRI